MNREELAGLMEEHSKKNKGSIGFVLAMEHEDEITIHDRFKQPCQGGETRKYFSTHGDKCTQPENKKPGDLECPFPPGRPVAIAFPLSDTPRNELSLRKRDLIISAISPYRAGFKDVTPHKEGLGFTIMDTHVDPTVMIQGVQHIRSRGGTRDEFGSFEDLDFLFLTSYCGWFPSEYYMHQNLSPRRFYEGKPNDLSGGSYYDGYDYNRSYNAHLFVPDILDLTKQGFRRDLYKINYYGLNVKDEAAKLLEKTHEFMASEPEPVVNPYKFLTYAGKQYDSHLDYITEIKK